MPISRVSVRYHDAVDEHGEDLAALVHATSALARAADPAPADLTQVAAQGRRVLASFEDLRRQAGAIDDAMRAIAMLARAGRDTPKVHRSLREIVADQDRLAASRNRTAVGPQEVQ